MKPSRAGDSVDFSGVGAWHVWVDGRGTLHVRALNAFPGRLIKAVPQGRDSRILTLRLMPLSEREDSQISLHYEEPRAHYDRVSIFPCGVLLEVARAA